MALLIRPSLKKGYLFNAAHTTLNILYPIVTFAFASRILGPANLGKVNVSFALSTFFLVLATLALPLYGPKAIAQAREDRDRLEGTFTGLFLMNAVSSLFWALFFLVLLSLNRTMRADWALYLTAGSCLAWNVFSVDWVYSGLEDFRSILMRNGAIKVASIVLLVLLVRSEGDFIWFAAINVFSASLGNLWGFLALGRHLRLRWRKASMFAHIKPLLWISASSVAASVYLQLDNVILGSMTDDRTVGLYSAAMRVVRITTVFLISLSLSMVPRISFYVENAMETEHHALIERSVRLLAFLSLPMTAFFIALAPQILMLVSGPEFVEASTAMRMASPVLFLASFANLVGFQILVPKGGERSLLAAMSLAAATSLLLNVLLIPPLGILGCVTAAVGAETVAVLTLVFQARKSLGPLKAIGGPVSVYLGLSLALGMAAWIIAGRFGNPWWALTASAAMMGTGYFALLHLGGDDITLKLERLVARLLTKACRAW